jgi:hypothetical protein
VGEIPTRARYVTVEKLAINAVLAGCKPEYFPFVLAGMSAVLDPIFNATSVVVSTGGIALCAMVSGPLAQVIGMNSGHSALGSGNRANATIGRALRLCTANVLGAKGVADNTTLGHPGKYTFCFAEKPPKAPWTSLSVDLGYASSDTTVTVVPAEAPFQVANFDNPDPNELANTFAAAIRNPAWYNAGKGGQAVVVLGPEHESVFIDGGWTRNQLKEALWERSRITIDELESAGVVIERGAQHDMTPGADGRLPCITLPSDLYITTAGGAGTGWSSIIRTWGPTLHARSVTRRVGDQNIMNNGG